MQVGVVATFIITKLCVYVWLFRYSRLVYVNNLRIVKLMFLLTVVEAVADFDISVIIRYITAAIRGLFC